MGQVAMATDHGGRPTMPACDAGSPIGGRSSKTREEAVTGPWTIRPLHRAPRDVGGANKKREWGVRFYSQTAAQVLRKVLRVASLRIVGWIWHFRWSILHM